jgi:hypothetical protein
VKPIWVHRFFKRKKEPKLLAREDSNPVQTVDLSTDFDLTGKEDWSKPQRIRVHRKQESPEDHWIKTTPQKTGLIVEASQGNKRERVMIDWVLKKN